MTLVMQGPGQSISEYLLQEIGEESLRSVVSYTAEEYRIEYVRDDVAALYEEADIDRVINDARMESLIAPVATHMVPDSHGELRCQVRCFEEVTEMNFVVGDGRGIAIGIEADFFGEQKSLLGKIRGYVRQELDMAAN